MEMVKTLGLVEISSSGSRTIVWYYAKNLNSTENYSVFLRSLMPELKNVLKTRVQQGAIKFNLNLEATYSLPSVLNSLENRAFKTSAVKIFPESNITEILERAYIKLLVEEDLYRGRGSGFRLHTVDGLLLAVYKYTPIGGSICIDLPQSIKENKEQEKTHQECTVCNLCKCNIVVVDKVRDHDHPSGKFRQTLCFSVTWR
ncbi:uncharacterized protein LOC111036275 [Myzus persicae]|uniref:uncharacterized protein LOC111036275 n=1 Tax=Myzus persicae TaxID=13164 RepID=UPI000B936E4B|nr:uncharacterized protein LOC111036275 [Myzus persicae]